MSYLRPVVNEKKDAFLTEAAEQRATASLTVRAPDGWSSYQGRVLEVGQAPLSLLIEYPAGPAGKPAPSISEGQLVGVTFRRGHRKCMFTSMVLGKERLNVDEHSQLGALRVQWPEEVQELQRRVYQRADVPATWDVEVGFWSGGTRLSARDVAEPPRFVGRLTNLSAGGIGVEVTDPSGVDQTLDTIYACKFTPIKHHPPFTMQAVLRHVSEGRRPGFLCLGMQFLGAEFAPRTLGRLARVVTQFHRFYPTTSSR